MKNFKIDSQGPRHIHECDDCKPIHTATPWLGNGNAITSWAVPGGEHVAFAPGNTTKEHWEANAAFIVQAVNSYYPLIVKLQAAAEFLKSNGFPVMADECFKGINKADWKKI